MKKIHPTLLIVSLSLILVVSACSSDNPEPIEIDNSETGVVLTQIEKEALTFMLEEERLARDVYDHLFAKWGLSQFENISISEQSHMDAVENLLKQYDLPYSILEAGTFQNAALQGSYDNLVAQGDVDLVGALTSGATIEDLDIFDLENWMGQIENDVILNVFSKLQCGSRNHLRAFTNSLDKEGETYTPQFISQTEYEQILLSDFDYILI
ncbi:MAG: DUF2202 domain-containing protein [Robiginitalea sp.]|uniref:DUF2202 domain-containing protein n=1 Tax=Robiginitalea sp. TaxID=1902411 RepID=UPI003C719B83